MGERVEDKSENKDRSADIAKEVMEEDREALRDLALDELVKQAQDLKMGYDDPVT